MDEQDFWTRMEFRIRAEFQGFADRRLRWYWCDGLVAEQYELLTADPCIRGRAWSGPSGQEPWRFVLRIGRGARTRAEIPWTALLPGEQATGWLSADPRRRIMLISPLVGYPE
ncbi:MULTISPECIES: hypothetical protein [unclassified Micromonospora]|uniref:hypothetical protein n=1 Tax=unclassified Micromonospora TaxID=2617518 RepID=UPI0022B61140|nr:MULTISPECIES: hypothetical protein [unclassified Micromonospora]MCZ7423408.1 hypothetical protein [Verrucosispora sp. WMMA2121]WBB91103.1 hypothetical protein O7597_29795 [Verrucosispora sp. WMMC514]